MAVKISLSTAINWIQMKLQGSSPATPASGFGRLFAKTSDKHLYWKDSTGTETDLVAGGSSFSWAQLTITGSGTSITAISELVDDDGIVSVSSPDIFIATAGLYLFLFSDNITISVTSASAGYMQIADPSFSLPGQAVIAQAGMIATGSSSGSKTAYIGGGYVTTIPTPNFQLTAACSRSGSETWSHLGQLSILKLA